MALLDIGFVLIGFIGGLFGGYLARDLLKSGVDTNIIEPYGYGLKKFRKVRR